ncbi:MAG: asparagine synthase (glutamine-hydrolyzing) [Aquisalimonadaceae bacterium]
MCGIAGIWHRARLSGHEPAHVLAAMGQAILHRGPDAGDQLWDEATGLGLVHRRLSIQDLSPAGAQPMRSASGRFVIVFNGEVYNFRALARELETLGHGFRGHSDTEVMLAAFEQWGVEPALNRLAGMFAFALWDTQARQLWLARDRMGEKPLYYGWHGDTFLFASELKAMRAFPGFNPEINRDALTLLLRHNYIPAPQSIYQGIHKLPPAHCLRLDLAAAGGRQDVRPVRYWALEDAFTPCADIDEASAVDALEQVLGDVIEEQMVADVPLGAFLSGGIDSSTVVALMQRRATRPVKTFTIGFEEQGFNEAEHAAAVARHLGTEHTELYVTPQDALDVIGRLPTIYDEPFADSSQIPTFLVSRMTREHVTVSLSGDGGDELFAGYDRYPASLKAWHRTHAAPGPRQHLERLLLAMPDSVSGPMARVLGGDQRRMSSAGLAEKLARERTLRQAASLPEFYRRRVGYWAHPAELVRDGREPDYALTEPLPEAVAAASPLKQLQWLDLNSYLPDDILTKVDRAAMAVSLETRVPMLDHRVVSFALGLPDRLNLKGGTGKHVLRQLLHRYVPQSLVDRPKQGFAVPVAYWLRHELRDWAEALLERSRLEQEGYWHAARVRQTWEDHLAGRGDYSFQLWGILMFQLWQGTPVHGFRK